MAILKIARMGHPVLRKPALTVADPTAADIQRLAADMIETMEDAHGTGLAAPQVHVPLRVVVFFVEGARAEREGVAEEVPLTVMVNPEIRPLSDKRASGWEACLSVPDLAGEVPRFTHIAYRFQDLTGQWQEREARDFHARVVQHECDHLDGLLYPQRMEDMASLMFSSELRHHRQDAEPIE